MASRTGPRLTPKLWASSTSLSWEPGSSVPLTMPSLSRSVTIEANVARGSWRAAAGSAVTLPLLR